MPSPRPLPTDAHAHAHANASLPPRPLDLPAHGAVQRRSRSGLVPLPLLGGLALCRPGVDGGDLVLEGGVYEAVALQRVEALELGRHDERGECLAAAACFREKGRLAATL